MISTEKVPSAALDFPRVITWVGVARAIDGIKAW